MARIAQSAKKNRFSGRMFNPLTQCYEFIDNSGCPITTEVAENTRTGTISFLHFLFVVKPELERVWYERKKQSTV